jgi:hypothetical protein
VIDVDPKSRVNLELQGLRHRLHYGFGAVDSGAFSWKLYPDRYTVTAYSDHNANGRWDLGSLRPFEFAEPAWIVADTVRIRARFEHSGQRFEFRGRSSN